MGSTAIKKVEMQALSPMSLLQMAIEREGSIDVIERLASLQMQMMDREAKIGFTEAFEEFKRTVPVIVKDSEIKIQGKDGKPDRVQGKYAKLDKVCGTLIPALLEVGITHRWKTSMAPNGNIVVTCFLRHRLGHEEEGMTLGAAPDQTGSKNPVQATGSTTAYLERYTLVGSCGIAIKDQDNMDSGVAPDDELLDYLQMMKDAADIHDLKDAYAKAFGRVRMLTDDGRLMKQVVDLNETLKADFKKRGA